MATDLSAQLQRLGHKSELLTTRFATLKSENEALRAREEDLQAQIRKLTAANEQMARELEFLRLSAAIAPNSQDTREARALISNLVREIDACVADLMKDI